MANPNTRGNKFIATVWQAEDKGKYGEASFTTFNKKKEGGYENSQFSFVRFVGNGFQGFDKIVKELKKSKKENKGVKIVISSMEISRKQYYDEASGKKVFPKNYSFVVWDWGFPEDEDGEDSVMDKAPVVEEEKEIDDDVFGEDEENPFGED